MAFKPAAYSETAFAGGPDGFGQYQSIYFSYGTK